MLLYLMRHGAAESPYTDSKRPLSGLGRQQVNRMAQLLAAETRPIDEIWHSTVLRARQTAEILSTQLGLQSRCYEKDGFKPNDSLEAGLTALEAAHLEKKPSLLIVGHLPYMPALVHALLGKIKLTQSVDFSEATIACIDCGSWNKKTLAWLQSPHQ